MTSLRTRAGGGKRFETKPRDVVEAEFGGCLPLSGLGQGCAEFGILPQRHECFPRSVTIDNGVEASTLNAKSRPQP